MKHIRPLTPAAMSGAADTAVATGFRRGHDFIRPVRPRLPRGLESKKDAEATEARLRAAHEAVEKFNRKVAHLVSEGQIPKAIRLARELFFSDKGRLVAANRARKKIPARRRNDLPSVPQLAALIGDLAVDEQVHIIAKPKRGSKPDRIISTYGVVDRARQELVALSFGKLATFAENQNSVRGKSREKAVQRVAELIQDRRYTYAVELDISRFFESVNPSVLPERLGIPDWVIAEILTNQGKENRGQIIPGSERAHRKWRNTLTRTRCGLPEGTITSPLFAQSLLKEPLERFAERFGDRVVIMNFGDNFLLLAPSAETAGWARESLNRLLTGSIKANIALQERYPVRRICDGFDFLGYRFRRRRGSPLVSLPADTKRNFVALVDEKIDEIRKAGTIFQPRLTREFARKVEGKLASFRMAPQDVDELLDVVDKRLPKLLRQSELRAVVERHRPTVAKRVANRFGRRRVKPFRRVLVPLTVPRSFNLRRVEAYLEERRNLADARRQASPSTSP